MVASLHGSNSLWVPLTPFSSCPFRSRVTMATHFFYRLFHSFFLNPIYISVSRSSLNSGACELESSNQNANKKERGLDKPSGVNSVVRQNSSSYDIHRFAFYHDVCLVYPQIMGFLTRETILDSSFLPRYLVAKKHPINNWKVSES